MIRAYKVQSVVLMLAIAVGGCSEEKPLEPGTFRVGVQEPASLLPAQVTDSAGRMVAGALWTPLTAHDPKTHQITPVAAAAVTSRDRVSWTIALRPGQRFHDGSVVTARSYVGAWQAAIAARWPGATVLTDVLRIKEIRAVDDRTVRLTLRQPLAQVPLILATPALYPLPDSVLASKDWTGFARHPIGTGPYRMAEPWQRGTRLTRFDGYPGKPGLAREIVVRVVDDPAAQFEQVRTGGLDLATAVPGASHQEMQRDFGDRHLLWPLPELTYLAFPLRDRRFQDPAVRHAVSLAIDRAALETGPLDRQVDPARSLLPPTVALRQRSGPCRPCNHDPQAAKALLDQVGGLTGPVPIYHGAGQERWVGALAEQLSRTLGIDAVPKPAGATMDGPFVVSRPLFTSSPREPMLGIPGYTHTGFAGLLSSADASTDQHARDQLYRVAENQLLRDLPVAPLWSTHGHAVWSTRLTVPGPELNLPTIQVP